MGYLVVMCSSEDEHQSYLASALDSYQTQFLHINRNVQSILQEAFCIRDKIRIDKKDKVLYGAVVDREG